MARIRSDSTRKLKRELAQCRRDLSQRYKREQEFRTLAENSTDVVARFDRTLRRIYVNPAIEAILGRPRAELLGKTHREMGLPVALADALIKALETVFATGQARTIEFTLPTPKGDLYLDSRLVPEIGPKGNVETVLGITRDITERQRAKSGLQEYAQGQDFLVGTALRLLQPLERPELYEFVTERLYLLADGGIVLFNEFDHVNRRTSLRAIRSNAEERSTAHRLFGRDPVGITLDFPESIREQMLPGEFTQLTGGICELAFYQLPQALCDALEWELGIRRVYAMACSVEQDLLGTVAVLTKGGELRNKRLIETVVTQLALALRRKRAEEALQSERNFFDSVYDSQGAIVAILDRYYRVVRLNRAYYDTTGFPLGGMIGQAFGYLMDTTSGELAERQLDVLSHQVAAGEFESLMRVEDGSTRNISWRATVRRDETGGVDYVIATGIDVTERKRMEESTRHLAEHDALTDLPNRRLLLELLDAAMRSAHRSRRKVALLFVDLDRFKAVNDTLGHEAGDALLKEVAQRLSARVRRSDVVARLAGDEFTVLLSELIRGEQAGEVAEEIVTTFQQAFHLAGQSAYVTASIGISLYPDDDNNPEGLLRCADLAMYEAKDQGRNTYRFYNPILHRRSQQQANIENRLRQALRRDELCLHYQPEIDLQTGRMVAVEVLVRWQHPELGLLDATRFIPVAEETGLVKALDIWVLRAACAQAKLWRDQGFSPIRMAVNLSAKSFESTDLIEVVRREVAKCELAPEQLELELTEHTVMQHIDQSIRQMRELVGLGVGITVDDFGTGYSSLNYIKRLPVGKLKIDKSFVRDIGIDSGDRAIIQAVATLAHTLNKRVIAEGVETEEQRAFLKDTGCDMAQGYLFTKPLAPERLAELLKN